MCDTGFCPEWGRVKPMLRTYDATILSTAPQGTVAPCFVGCGHLDAPLAGRANSPKMAEQRDLLPPGGPVVRPYWAVHTKTLLFVSMLLPDFLWRGSAKPSPGEKVPNAVRRMRNSDGSQIRKQYHETRKVPILPKLPTDLQAFAIPHPALRATFPPGEGIGATAKNEPELYAYAPGMSGNDLERTCGPPS